MRAPPIAPAPFPSVTTSSCWRSNSDWVRPTSKKSMSVDSPSMRAYSAIAQLNGLLFKHQHGDVGHFADIHARAAFEVEKFNIRLAPRGQKRRFRKFFERLDGDCLHRIIRVVHQL